MKPIAVIRTYDQLVNVVRQRIFSLNATYDSLDAAAGLADRHTSKLLCGTKRYGPLSLMLTLQALGLVLLVAEDGEQDRVRARLTPRRYPIPAVYREEQTPGNVALQGRRPRQGSTHLDECR
jgi:hypothetical protein